MNQENSNINNQFQNNNQSNNFNNMGNTSMNQFNNQQPIQSNFNNQQNIVQNQSIQKDLKTIKKEEKKRILKARGIIGTHYLITLILVDLPMLLFLSLFFHYLKDNALLGIIIGYIWYIILPRLGADLIKVIQCNKLSTYITKENYSKIKKYSIIDLAILGFLHVTINFDIFVDANFNVFVIPVIISFVLSVLYLIREMDKIYKSKTLIG